MTSSLHKPMLAAAITVDELHRVCWPKVLQIKLDGIRGTLVDGQMLSRSGKLLPNAYVQQWFRILREHYPAIDYIDGEFIVGDPTAPTACYSTSSAIMSHAGSPNFTFYAFDLCRDDMNYVARRRRLEEIIRGLPDGVKESIQLVEDWIVHGAEDVKARMQNLVDAGHEGCILREPKGRYKRGRSTVREGLLLKIKDIVDEEAIIIDFEEQFTNLNEAYTDAQGYQKRSSHQDNQAPADTLGALVVRSPKWSGAFRIGTGFDSVTRKRIWDNQEAYKGKIVKFKYLKVGQKDLPRHPSFIGIRAESDMDPYKLDALKRLASV